MAREEHWLSVWRFDGTLPLDESVMLESWLPTTGAGWVDVSASVVRPVVLNHRPQDRGWSVQLTHRNESRLDWPEGRPVAFVGQHWFDGVYGARELICWGFLQGEGTSTLRRDGTQVATRTVAYGKEWDRRAVPAMQVGRPNLMLAATFDADKSVAPLATPEAEIAYGEYASPPADVTGAAAIDGLADTVAVSALVADAAPATAYGNTVADGRPVPRVAAIYGGRSSTVIGAGDETIFFVLACRARHITWGDFADRAAVPGFHEEEAGPTYPAEKNTTLRNTFFAVGGGRNGGTSLRVRCKSGVAADPTMRIGIQWNTQSSWVGLPALLSFWIKAGAGEPASVGKLVRATAKQADPQSGAGTVLVVGLTAEYRRYQVPLDSLGNYGGVMLRFQNEAGEVASSDCVFELSEVEVLVGYSDELHAVATNRRFHFAYDNGLGTSAYVRVAWDLLPADWTIPPGGAVIVADDGNAFRAKFDPGELQVASLRAKAPAFYLAPGGAQRLKTSFAQNTVGLGYDAPAGGGILIEEVLCSGLSWTQGANPQMLRRQSPLLTGAFVAEDYPTLAIDPADAFGPSYWTYQLAAYAPPALVADLAADGLVALVESVEAYPESTVAPGIWIVQVQDELIRYTSTEEGLLVLHTRGWNPSGPPFTSGPGAPAFHPEGTPVYPWRSGARQIGHLVADVEIRRLAGTARILDAVLLASNEVNPASPAPDFELTAGGVWQVFGRIQNMQGEVATVTAPNGLYVEARWLCLRVNRMEYRSGDAQRGKVNEIVARAHYPGATSAAGYRSRLVGTVADLVGYLLVQHGGVAAARYLPGTAAVPIEALPLARGTLGAALDAATRLGGLATYADGHGRARLVPTPASPFFTPGAPTRTWTVADLREEVGVRWRSRASVAQVQLVAREVGGLRTHVLRFPQVAGRRGGILEAKDVTVANIEQARAHTRALYYQGNAQRTPPVVTGHVPGLALFDRHVVSLPDADLGGQIVGVNCYVTGFSITVGAGPQGSTTWRTAIDLEELAL